MQKVVEEISKQQKAMGYIDFINESIENRMDYFRDISIALIKEVSETLDEVPWKPWRGIHEQVLNKNKAALEVCDVIVFAIVLYIILEPSDSLEENMKTTLAKINERINTEGYGREDITE